MRKIKFRGKRLDNGEWVKGSGIKISKNGTIIIYDEISCQWYEVDPETVGQYINRKDKNGREIYEGDIVKVLRKAWRSYGEIKGIIKYLEEELEYALVDCIVKQPTGMIEKWNETWLSQDDLNEIIGNIYDNPELIEMWRYENVR